MNLQTKKRFGRTFQVVFFVAFITASLALLGCGGGGGSGGGNGAGNTAPDANAVANPANGDEIQTEVTLDGSGSIDGDGAISSFLWEQVGILPHLLHPGCRRPTGSTRPVP